MGTYDETMMKFKGEQATLRKDDEFDGCHMMGGCIPDPTKAVVVTVEGKKGGSVENIYFLHCDGFYRNALS